MENRILRLTEVAQITGLSATTIYRKAKLGEFPTQFRLGVNSVGWLAAEVDEWIEQRVSSRGANNVK